MNNLRLSNDQYGILFEMTATHRQPEADIKAAFESLLGSEILRRELQRIATEASGDPLTAWERLAIWAYTTGAGSYYLIFNDKKIPHLNRDQQTEQNILIRHVSILRDILSAALLKLPPVLRTSYRWITVSDPIKFQKEHYEKGQEFVWTTFTSTGHDVKNAFVGNILFRILGYTGRFIELYSSSPSENEILFPQGFKGRVISTASFHDEDDMVIINVEEII